VEMFHVSHIRLHVIYIFCYANAFFSFDLFMVYIPECKKPAKNYEIIHTDTSYCKL